MTSPLIAQRVNALNKLVGIDKSTIIITKAFNTNQNIVFQSGDNFSYTATEPLAIDTKILLYKQDILGFNGIYVVSSNPSGLDYILTRQIKSTDLNKYIVNINSTYYAILQDKDPTGITFEITPFTDYEDVVREVQRLDEAKANQSTTYTKTQVDNALDLKEDKSNKNIAGGYVGLNSNSLISIPQITPSRFLAAGTNITLNEDPATKIVTISSTGGGGGGGSSNLPSNTLFSFRERIGSINWTINGGSNTFFNFTDEFFTQTIVNEDFNFLTGANPYFIYDSVGQKLLMRSNLTNQRIKFKITLRVSYNGGAGSEFAFVLGRPSLTTNNSVTNTIGVQKATQGQNIQSTQVIKHELTLFTTLLPTTGGTDPFQTEGFKLGFFNYSTSTAITITDAQLVIEQIN